MNIKLRLQDITATKKSNFTMGWFDNVINDVVKVAEEVWVLTSVLSWSSYF
jgi:hypothetical protein